MAFLALRSHLFMFFYTLRGSRVALRRLPRPHHTPLATAAILARRRDENISYIVWVASGSRYVIQQQVPACSIIRLHYTFSARSIPPPAAANATTPRSAKAPFYETSECLDVFCRSHKVSGKAKYQRQSVLLRQAKPDQAASTCGKLHYIPFPAFAVHV